VRALLAFGRGRDRDAEQLLQRCRELGRSTGAAIGFSQPRELPEDASRAYREARDAAMIARGLLGDGGAIGYSEVGAYRYLVQIGPGDAPRDRMRAAVESLIAYDRKRRTSLLDTLERYLSERCSVIDSARPLFVHPNTLRQRLGRI
jgi:DNA-binding PucR family transcriptional regulator